MEHLSGEWFFKPSIIGGCLYDMGSGNICLADVYDILALIRQSWVTLAITSKVRIALHNAQEF